MHTDPDDQPIDAHHASEPAPRPEEGSRPGATPPPETTPHPDAAPALDAFAGPIAPLVNDWFHGNARDLPWRRPGFPAWGTLVSEFMLQQTQVSRVIPRLEEWLERWPTPADLAAVPPSEAVRAWGRLGYPRRALWLHAAATQITERFGGVVPDDVDELLSLTGIGDYTARAVATFAYGRRHPVVDTNIRRVIARAVDGDAEPGPPNAKRDLPAMEALLPEDVGEAAVFNAGMMEIGAIVCTSRSPLCEQCPLVDRCAWRAAGYPEYTGPVKAKQKAFAGSDRQVRGLVMAELRSTHRPVPETELAAVWSDAEQLARAVAGLVSDGLAVRSPEGYALPHE